VIWRGLNLSIDAGGTVTVDEIWDEADAFELIYNPCILGKRARGSQKPDAPDFAPGLSVYAKASGSVHAEIHDESALAAWADARLDDDERADLEAERDGCDAGDEVDRAIEDMKDVLRG